MEKTSVKTNLKKFIALILLVVIAFSSATFMTNYANNDERYQEIIESIDNKKSTVTTITLAADAASLAIAAIPGDATTPIAEKILDVTSYLVIVISALVLEKVLLKSLVVFTFKLLIPIICLILALSIIMTNQFLKTLGIKLLVFSIVVANIIPMSIKVSDYVYNENKNSISQVTKYAEEKQDNNSKETTEETENSNKSWFEKTKNKVTQAAETIKEKVTTTIATTIDDAKRILNQFIDSVAILILTSCVIPVGLILVVLWLLKFLFGTTIPMDKGKEFFDKYKSKKKEALKTIPVKSLKE